MSVARNIERIRRFYESGPADDDAGRIPFFATDVVWHVPGDNAIAGVYEGREAVMAYFARRRDLAARTFRMHPGDLLTGDGSRVAVLTDGSAQIGGREHRWSTVGLYELRGEQVAACWLLPLDTEAFDAVWR